jgi:hypothetical protein
MHAFICMCLLMLMLLLCSNLYSNNLEGTLPDIFGYSKIPVIHLYDNLLTGTIPESFIAMADSLVQLYDERNTRQYLLLLQVQDGREIDDYCCPTH